MVNDMHTRRRRLQLTSFRLDMKLGMYSVVSTIEKTAVDGKNSQLGIQQQLSGVVLRLTLHTTHTSQYNLSISYKVTCISSAFSHCSTVYMHQFSPCRRYLPSLLTMPTILTTTSHRADVTYHHFSPCRRYLPSLLTVPTLLTISSHRADVTHHHFSPCRRYLPSHLTMPTLLTIHTLEL